MNTVVINYNIEVEDQAEKVVFSKRVLLPFVPSKEIATDIYAAGNISGVFYSVEHATFTVSINGFCDDHNEVQFAHSYAHLGKVIDSLEGSGYAKVEK